MRTRLFAAAVGAATLAAVSVAVAASDQDLVAGAGKVPVGDQFSVSGHSGPLGEDPRGHVTVTTTVPQTTDTKFRGDVKDGCVRVEGNRAAVVGELDESQQFVVPEAPPFVGPVKYAAVIVEDNDDVVGRPPDRAFPVLLFERTGDRVCAGITPLSAFPMEPLESGNVVVHDATAP